MISVEYNKPKWMESNDLRKRAIQYRQRIKSTDKNDVLPEYPIKIEPNMNDNLVRKSKPKVFKKVSYDKKKLQ